MQEPLIHEPLAIFMVMMLGVLIAPLLSQQVRLPGIVGLMLLGVVIGENGLHLLATDRIIELFGSAGLIYLMFNAGLEINLEQFKRLRSQAIPFGLLSFLLPQLAGIGVGRWFGLEWPAAILLGSAFASHTLIAYPILSRLGIISNPAIAMTIGATIITDIAALLILAVVVGTGSGETSVSFMVRVIAFGAIFGAVMLFGLPRLARLFFRRFPDTTADFRFVLAVLFVAAVTAELIGLHPILGAFVASLALNASLPKSSPVVGRILFLGNAFFIPMFLLSVGMRLNPVVVLTDSRTLILGLVLIAATYVTKFAAAWITSRRYGYTRDETMIIWGLSHAQAAATLATILVGYDAGVLPEFVLDASILLILVTSVSSPLIVRHFGSKQAPHTDPNEQESVVLTSEPDTKP